MAQTFSMAVRTFITITALVAVPLLAVVGDSHPEAVRWLDRLRPPPVAATALADGAADAAEQTRTGSSSGAAHDDAASPPLYATDPAPDAAPPPAHRERETAVQSAPRAQPTPPPAAGLWGELAADPLAEDALPDRPGSESEPDVRPRSLTVPGENPAPEGAALAEDDPPAEAEDSPATADEQFTALATRLRELGAAHYRLETYGAAGQLYRFRCLMAIPGRPGQNKYFMAVAPQPLEAMLKALDEIEPWHAHRVAALEESDAGRLRR
jgi:hypothetical protein